MSGRLPDDVPVTPRHEERVEETCAPVPPQQEQQQVITEAVPVDDNSPASRLRRSVYCFVTNFVGMAGIIYLAKFSNGPVAENAVGGLSDICMFTTAAYLGISVMDRSRILSHLGERIRRGPQL